MIDSRTAALRSPDRRACRPRKTRKRVNVNLIETLGPFWIIGIAVNLVFTGLALWWIFRQMYPRKPARSESKPGTGS